MGLTSSTQITKLFKERLPVLEQQGSRSSSPLWLLSLEETGMGYV
jgi:hypothetical protein